MVRGKRIREKGKIKLSRYFQELNIGDFVAIDIEKAISINFPKRLQGRTGIIKEKRGRAYVVKVRDQSKEKEFIIEPVHLKKIKTLTGR
ncbi:MAG: 50S ribosomal protein L21e [Candidatus Pacearchaeota archaeon]|nr:MAG: 50S ribosomal protein L21e [Candidatus Pacearchaeota archaeon]